MLKKAKCGWSIESTLWDEAVGSGKGVTSKNLMIMLNIFICIWRTKEFTREFELKDNFLCHPQTVGRYRSEIRSPANQLVQMKDEWGFLTRVVVEFRRCTLDDKRGTWYGRRRGKCQLCLVQCYNSVLHKDVSENAPTFHPLPNSSCACWKLACKPTDYSLSFYSLTIKLETCI